MWVRGLGCHVLDLGLESQVLVNLLTSLVGPGDKTNTQLNNKTTY